MSAKRCRSAEFEIRPVHIIGGISDFLFRQEKSPDFGHKKETRRSLKKYL